MQKNQLGKTDLQITPIGFGAWAIGGGGWAFSWGPQDDQTSIAALLHAVDQGINWIDTAAIYGYGHSEEVVGRALKELGPSRRPYIFTKCGMIPPTHNDGAVTHNLHTASIRQEVENSLRRLDIDVIDLYQIHWPNPAADISEGWQTLIDLQSEGKVRYVGVSNFNVQQLQQAQAIGPVNTLQPPYSLLHRGVEPEVLPYCAAENIGVIVYSPMASGLLTGAMTPERVASLSADDWRKRSRAFQSPEIEQNLQLVALLAAIGEQHGRSAGEVAIAWTLHNPAVTAAIVGARSPQQIDGIIGAADFRLSTEEIAQIEQFVTTHQVSKL